MLIMESILLNIYKKIACYNTIDHVFTLGDSGDQFKEVGV